MPICCQAYSDFLSFFLDLPVMSACICTKRGFLPRPPQRKRVLIECPADSMASIMRRVPNLKGRTEESISTVAKVNDWEHLLSVYPVPDAALGALDTLPQKVRTQRLHCPWSHHYIKLQSRNSNLGLPDSKTFWIIAPFASISSYTMLTKRVDNVNTVHINTVRSNTYLMSVHYGPGPLWGTGNGVIGSSTPMITVGDLWVSFPSLKRN